MITALLWLTACSGVPSDVQRPAEIKQKGQNSVRAQKFENMDQGQKHPPIPANNPAWEWDAGGFVPDYGWYGEHNWNDVRMRVAGHLSAAGRDLARIHAQKGDYKKSAEAYMETRELLQAIPSPSEGYSKKILDALINAVERDVRWTEALAEGRKPAEEKGEISALRSRYLQLAVMKEKGDNVAEKALKLQNDIEKSLVDRPELAIDNFKDFISRHELRVKLYRAYLDSLDPIGLEERWGYWVATEINRQLHALGMAAGMMGARDWKKKVEEKYGSKEVVLKEKSPLLWPSEILDQIKDPDQKLDNSAEEYGRLPTGDSLIDVAAHPGPLAIGDLMKWGLDDKEHRSWLENIAKEINSLINGKPEAAVQKSRDATEKMNKADHGSKFYNIKQLRNAATRQLARGGRFNAAADLWMDSLKLHHQDWACPNREGIVLAVAGRLQAEGDDSKAENTLKEAMAAGKKFLELTIKAEAGQINGPRPPALTPKRGPQRPNGPHTPPPVHRKNGAAGPSGKPPRR